MREAKQQTSWVANNNDFEDALNAFIDVHPRRHRLPRRAGILRRPHPPAWPHQLARANAAEAHRPGVPDLYQGGELWDLSLVDPDNRRPVDYDLRRKLLAELAQLSPAQTSSPASTKACPSSTSSISALLLRREHPHGSAARRPTLRSPPSAQRPATSSPSCAANHVIDRRPAPLPHPRSQLGLTPRSPLPPGTWHNRLTGRDAS